MQMSVQEKEFLNIDFKGGSTWGEVTLLMLEDHGHHIAYLPTLKLSAYGDTPEEAKAMLKEVIDEFFLDLVALPEYEAQQELTKLGWVRNSAFEKKFSIEAFVDKEGVLRNFNLPPETVIREIRATVVTD